MSVNNTIIKAQQRIVDRLVEWEELVGKLYLRYAERFPDQGPTWRQLAREEQTHAAALGAIRKMLDAGHLLENVGQFDGDIIEQEVDEVRAALQRAEHPNLQLHEAVATAREIEHSVIESQFYDTVTCSAPDFQRIAQRLRGDTQRHIDKLRSLDT